MLKPAPTTQSKQARCQNRVAKRTARRFFDSSQQSVGFNVRQEGRSNPPLLDFWQDGSRYHAACEGSLAESAGDLIDKTGQRAWATTSYAVRHIGAPSVDHARSPMTIISLSICSATATMVGAGVPNSTRGLTIVAAPGCSLRNSAIWFLTSVADGAFSPARGPGRLRRCSKVMSPPVPESRRTHLIIGWNRSGQDQAQALVPEGFPRGTRCRISCVVV